MKLLRVVFNVRPRQEEIHQLPAFTFSLHITPVLMFCSFKDKAKITEDFVLCIWKIRVNLISLLIKGHKRRPKLPVKTNLLRTSCNYDGVFAAFAWGGVINGLSLSGGRRNAPVDHRTQRMWQKLPVQDPQRLVAGVRRPAPQTFSRTHVLHPSEVHTQTHTLIIIRYSTAEASESNPL